MKRILADEDIKKVWEGIVIITLENVADFIKGGGVKHKICPMTKC